MQPRALALRNGRLPTAGLTILRFSLLRILPFNSPARLEDRCGLHWWRSSLTAGAHRLPLQASQAEQFWFYNRLAILLHEQAFGAHSRKWNTSWESHRTHRNSKRTSCRARRSGEHKQARPTLRSQTTLTTTSSSMHVLICGPNWGVRTQQSSHGQVSPSGMTDQSARHFAVHKWTNILRTRSGLSLR